MSQMENACKQEYGEQRTCYSLIDWFFKDSAEWPDTAKHPQVCAGNSDPVSVGNNHSSFSKNPKIIPSLIFEEIIEHIGIKDILIISQKKYVDLPRNMVN